VSSKETLSKLLKCLKEGKINRDVVCDTIMSQEDGLDLLIKLARTSKSDHTVLKSIVRSWRNPIESADQDSVVREILDMAK
jgi:hypothetical protein